MAVVGGTHLGQPILLGCIYSFATHSKVGKCCCGSFIDDGPRHQGQKALEAVYGKIQDLQVPSTRLSSHVLIPSMSRWRFGFLQTKGAISWLLPPKSRQRGALGSGPSPI